MHVFLFHAFVKKKPEDIFSLNKIHKYRSISPYLYQLTIALPRWTTEKSSSTKGALTKTSELPGMSCYPEWVDRQAQAWGSLFELKS